MWSVYYDHSGIPQLGRIVFVYWWSNPIEEFKYITIGP